MRLPNTDSSASWDMKKMRLSPVPCPLSAGSPVCLIGLLYFNDNIFDNISASLSLWSVKETCFPPCVAFVLPSCWGHIRSLGQRGALPAFRVSGLPRPPRWGGYSMELHDLLSVVIRGNRSHRENSRQKGRAGRTLMLVFRFLYQRTKQDALQQSDM